METYGRDVIKWWYKAGLRKDKMGALITLAAPKACDEREQRVIELERAGRSLDEVASALGVSRRRAGEVQRSAHTKIAEYVDREGLHVPTRRELEEAAHAVGL